MIIKLTARAPFNFNSVVRSHGWYRLAPLEWGDEHAVLTNVMRLDSGRVIETKMQGDDAGVEVAVNARLRSREQREVSAKVAWTFALDRDLSEFYSLADAEPRLAHVRAKAMGRFLRSPTMWEDAVKTMMTTNIQWTGTKRLVAALVRAFGEPLPADSGRKSFPTSQAIARRRESTLRGLGLGYRAPYLLQLARAVDAGKMDLEALKESAEPTEELRRRMLQLPGIGPYAAASLLGLLGRHDFIGVDSEAVKLVSQGFYGGRPVGEKEVNAVFARFGQHKSLAYWFWDWDGQQQAPMDAWEAKGHQRIEDRGSRIED